ncbi:alpha/beta hydrolase family protein [Paractinoplanes lichenicola]|uniref:Chlorophyllase n=1 Tax=Paractinoplanes lichenicola TaxID=2802976 RepID=A0ABS1VFG1_9ACTN|nr:chlorophyllase [Actinoplanes lichenicola]MBL7253435.1 chlorophyllase [Actinoplanes lichenicola]
MSTAISESGNIPVNAASPVITYSPVVFDVPGRPARLEIKVSAPATGTRLPIILLSHGHGETNFIASLHGNAPMAGFYAAHGFVVIQPTHLDDKALGLRESGHPGAPMFWRSRVTDMHFILDHLDEIEATVPGLAGRLDRERIAAVGHSLGGHTTSMLLGSRVDDPEDPETGDLSDPRVKAGVILASPGVSDEATDGVMMQRVRMLRFVNFDTMTTPALVVAGDKDLNENFSTRLSYRSDAYTRAPAPKTLLTMHGAEHIFGGITGFDTVETTDENPERVATLRALIWAYLRSALYPGDNAWPAAVAALESGAATSSGSVESK